MNFKLVLNKIISDFNEQNIRYALIGGIALGAWGVTRATIDLDFLVIREDMRKVHEILRGLGYKKEYRSENVSQYIAQDRMFGEIDFLHAFRAPSLKIIKRAVTKKMFNETLPVKIAGIEDLIGLKIQAMANDESRITRDLGDIESLMATNRKNIDWSIIEEYFELFELNELLHRLQNKYLTDDK